MGKVIDFNLWKANKGIVKTVKEEFDLTPCPTCQAPVVKEGEKYRFDEDVFLDFLYEEAEDFIEAGEKSTDEIEISLAKLSKKVSKNESNLLSIESKIEDFPSAC